MRIMMVGHFRKEHPELIHLGWHDGCLIGDPEAVELVEMLTTPQELRDPYLVAIAMRAVFSDVPTVRSEFPPPEEPPPSAADPDST